QNSPILGNYRSDQLLDWEPKGKPNPSQWPGELGQKCIVPEDTETYNKFFKYHEFNVLASDRIALNRTLRDSRSDSCQSKQYPNQLPDASVIIVFHNEAYSTLLRTLHIYLKQHLKHYVRELSVPIKIIRLGRRSGLIQARILGSSHAVGRVLIFLDSHCECNEGWLEPLLDRIAGDRTRVVCPIIDVIDEHSFRYVTASDMTYGGFNWKFGFRWYTAPDSELIRRNNDRTLPLRTPALSGGLYAIDRQFFEYIGKYDSKMVIWGAENIEISLRIWMCGGSIEIVTCSRVGHVFRNKTPYTLPGGSNYIVWHNTARLAHVWLDDWTHFFFTLYPSARQIDVGIWHNTARLAHVWLDDWTHFFFTLYPSARQIDVGSIAERVALRKQRKCHSFQWYLDNVYPESLLPKDYYFLGDIRNMKNEDICLDSVQSEEATITWDLIISGRNSKYEKKFNIAVTSKRLHTTKRFFKRKYKSCNSDNDLLSNYAIFLQSLLLIVSNFFLLPAVYLALKCKYLGEAFIYFLTMFCSSFYHMCDNEKMKYCIFNYEVLQFCDFYSAILTLWVTAILMSDMPYEWRSVLHLTGSLFFAGLLRSKTTGVWSFVVPAVCSLILLAMSWV
ncbi:unnamed protein product, partial [Medioppia subpectinata]